MVPYCSNGKFLTFQEDKGESYVLLTHTVVLLFCSCEEFKINEFCPCSDTMLPFRFLCLLSFCLFWLVLYHSIVCSYEYLQ